MAVFLTPAPPQYQDPVLVWAGFLSQFDEYPPTTQAKYNTLGLTMTWSRTSTGRYEAALNITLDPARLFIVPNNTVQTDGGDALVGLNISYYQPTNVIRVSCTDPTTVEDADLNVQNAALRIFYYPA